MTTTTLPRLRRALSPLGIALFLGLGLSTGPLPEVAGAQSTGGNPQDAEGGAVIEPGKEPLLAEMLGQGATLPGNCSFDGGDIQRSFVRAKYLCPGGEVLLDARHVKTVGSPAAATSQFALSIASGTPPEGLVEAIAGRIREREAGFQWKWIERTKPTSGGPESALPYLGGAGLLAIVAFLLWRRRPSSAS